MNEKQVETLELFLSMKKKQYYKLVKEGEIIFGVTNFFEYKNKSDRKTLSVKKYIYETRPYLKAIINDLKKSDSKKL